MKPSSQYTRWRRPDPSAFSLVALLVVLAVLSTLVLLTTSVVDTARRSSMQAVNVHNLRQVGLALLNYANDYNGDIPPSPSDDIFGRTGNPTWGPILTGPPRYLFTSKWGSSFKGRHDYLETPDVFYSPFVKNQERRKKGQFYQNATSSIYLGYILYFSPAENRIGGVLSNLNVRTASTPAPIYSDFCSDIGKTWGYSSDQCSVLYLDGSVRTFLRSEVDSLKFVDQRVKLFMSH